MRLGSIQVVTAQRRPVFLAIHNCTISCQWWVVHEARLMVLLDPSHHREQRPLKLMLYTLSCSRHCLRGWLNNKTHVLLTCPLDFQLLRRCEHEHQACSLSCCSPPPRYHSHPKASYTHNPDPFTFPDWPSSCSRKSRDGFPYWECHVSLGTVPL